MEEMKATFDEFFNAMANLLIIMDSNLGLADYVVKSAFDRVQMNRRDAIENGRPYGLINDFRTIAQSAIDFRKSGPKPKS